MGLIEVSIAGEFYSAGQIQWDGKYLTIQDLSFDTISRVQFSGAGGTVVGVTMLGKMASDSAYQSWIQGGTMLVPYTTQKNRMPTVGLWRYPAGGNHPEKKVQQPGSLPNAVAVSLADNFFYCIFVLTRAIHISAGSVKNRQRVDRRLPVGDHPELRQNDPESQDPGKVSRH